MYNLNNEQLQDDNKVKIKYKCNTKANSSHPEFQGRVSMTLPTNTYDSITCCVFRLFREPRDARGGAARLARYGKMQGVAIGG